MSLQLVFTFFDFIIIFFGFLVFALLIFGLAEQ